HRHHAEVVGPPRGDRVRGRRPRSRCAGYTLVELMVVVALIATLACVALAQAMASLDHGRGHAAARFLAARLALARTQAVARRVAIGLRFEQVPGGFAFSHLPRWQRQWHSHRRHSGWYRRS